MKLIFDAKKNSRVRFHEFTSLRFWSRSRCKNQIWAIYHRSKKVTLPKSLSDTSAPACSSLLLRSFAFERSTLTVEYWCGIVRFALSSETARLALDWSTSTSTNRGFRPRTLFGSKAASVFAAFGAFAFFAATGLLARAKIASGIWGPVFGTKKDDQIRAIQVAI